MIRKVHGGKVAPHDCPLIVDGTRVRLNCSRGINVDDGAVGVAQETAGYIEIPEDGIPTGPSPVTSRDHPRRSDGNTLRLDVVTSWRLKYRELAVRCAQKAVVVRVDVRVTPGDQPRRADAIDERAYGTGRGKRDDCLLRLRRKRTGNCRQHQARMSPGEKTDDCLPWPPLVIARTGFARIALFFCILHELPLIYLLTVCLSSLVHFSERFASG